MRRHGQREFVAGQQNAAAFLVAQIQMFLKLAEGSYAVLELPFPIIPEFRRRVRPITWRMRDELFSVPIYRGKSVHFLSWTKKLRPLNIVSMQAPGRALRTWMNAAESGYDGPLQVGQRRPDSRPILFATCNKNESCPCLASNDKPTGTPSASAIGSDTCGRRQMPAMLVRPNVRG